MESGSELKRLEKIYQDLSEESNKAAEAQRKEELALHRRVELLYKERCKLTLQQKADSHLLAQLRAMAARVKEECCQARLKAKILEEQRAVVNQLYLGEINKEAKLKKTMAEHQKLQQLKEETSCMEDTLKEVREIGEILSQKKQEELERLRKRLEDLQIKDLQKKQTSAEQQATRRTKWWKRLKTM
eukprot:superscaffoldBa00010811_g24902